MEVNPESQKAMDEQLETNMSNEQQEFIEGLNLSRALLYNILDAPKMPDPISETILNKCEKCGEDFPTQKGLNNHAKTHVRESPGWTDMDELQEHKPTRNSATKNGHKKKKKKYKCQFCSKRFLVKSILDEHILYHEQEKRVRQLISKDDLPKKDAKTKSYICEICHKVFHNVFIFKHHSESHNRDIISSEIFTCEVCKKQFKQKTYLKRHRKEKHSDESKYFCQLCDKKFGRAQLLKNHTEKYH